jgi:hypothetical protein
MKKIVLLLTILVGTLTAQAGDYTYLTFETTDGAKASVSVSDLTLTISGTTLTAGNHQCYSRRSYRHLRPAGPQGHKGEDDKGCVYCEDEE